MATACLANGSSAAGSIERPAGPVQWAVRAGLNPPVPQTALPPERVNSQAACLSLGGSGRAWFSGVGLHQAVAGVHDAVDGDAEVGIELFGGC